jgi:hypothetical protein
MDRRQISHDILNLLERFRIMHDLAQEEKFEDISKAEMEQDLVESLKKLEENFKQLLQ